MSGCPEDFVLGRALGWGDHGRGWTVGGLVGFGGRCDQGRVRTIYRAGQGKRGIWRGWRPGGGRGAAGGGALAAMTAGAERKWTRPEHMAQRWYPAMKVVEDRQQSVGRGVIAGPLLVRGRSIP